MSNRDPGTHSIISLLNEVPDVRLMMRSAAHPHNLSVMMPRSILWYGPGSPNCAVPRFVSEKRAGASRSDTEGFRHPRELGHGFGA
jgi:hypothetical protein